MPRTSPPRKDKNRVPRQKRELPATPTKEAERIAKVVARAGLGSRREIEEWIEAGRVAVNGEVLTTPAFTVTPADTITVDGAPLPERERTRLYIYHKPKGVVTTNRDPEGRTTLFEILPEGLPRLVSIGRLDLNSEGLLLFTNDGGLARVLELPETGWLRRYRVRVNGEVNQAQLDNLLKGVTVDGVEYGPIEAELDRVQGANAWITVSLREGKNREIRNVLGALGLQVNRLIRISYGPFQLGEIPEAGIEEVRTRVLRDQIGADIATASGADFEGPVVEREIGEAPPRVTLRPAGRKQAAADTAGGFKVPARRGARPQEDFDAPVEDVIRPAGPRARRRMSDDNTVESRGAVADRKGRTVKVERVVASRQDPDERGARSGAPRRDDGRPGARQRDDARPPGRVRDRDAPGFERPRRGPSEGKPAGRPFRSDERGPRREAEGREDFRRRPTRAEGEERPRRFRDRDEGANPGRADAPRRSYNDDGGIKRSGPRRPEGEKRFGERPQGDRPIRSRTRPEGGGYEERPPARGRSFGDKPPARGERPGGARFKDERPQSERPARPRPRPEGRTEGRGGFEERPPARGRSFGDKPAPRGERPRGERPQGERPRAERPQSERPQGDRPFRARTASEGRGGDYGERPAGRPGGFGGKPGGKPAGRAGGKPAGRPAGKSFGKPGGKPAGKPGGRPGGGKPSAPRGKR